MLKHKEKLNKYRVKIIAWVAFFIGFSQAVSMYVLSTFFEEIVGANMVGYFYAGAYTVFLIILLNLHKLVKRFGKYCVFSLACLFEALALCLLIFLGVSDLSAYLAASFIIFSMLSFVVLDIILESYSKDEYSGRIRGMYLTIYNSGLLFGPVVSTWLLSRFDFKGVFLLVFFLVILILVIFLITADKFKHDYRRRLKVIDVLKKSWKKKNIIRIYYVSFILEVFYALTIIYMPIYLREIIGLSWGEIGRVFTFMLIPFVLLQYPVGVMADKRYGEKEFLFFSLTIMAISTGLIYFFVSESILYWSIILFATRIGAALIEILRDSYFYKQVDGQDVDLIDFFRTAMPVGYIFAAILSSILLIFFPIKIVFLLIVVVAISGFYPVYKLKDSR